MSAVFVVAAGGEVIRDGAAAAEEPETRADRHLYWHRESRWQTLHLHGVHAGGEYGGRPCECGGRICECGGVSVGRLCPDVHTCTWFVLFIQGLVKGPC